MTVLFALISIVLSSLIVGGLARLAVPGPDPMPIWMTILIGFLGSVVGVVVGQLLFGRNATHQLGEVAAEQEPFGRGVVVG